MSSSAEKAKGGEEKEEGGGGQKWRWAWSAVSQSLHLECFFFLSSFHSFDSAHQVIASCYEPSQVWNGEKAQ